MAGNQTLKRSGQARSNERALLFLVFQQNLNASPDASHALNFLKNWSEMRKLGPPKVEGVKNWKKTNHRTLQSWFLNTQKIPCMLPYCY